MRQRAVVISTNGELAEIEVSRSTMCDGCHKNGECGHTCELSGIVSGGKKMTTMAQNRVGAEVGDIVEVETEDRKVLGYAALVFLMPLLVCSVFYFIADAISDSDLTSMIVAALGFVLSFVALTILDRRKKRQQPDIIIVSAEPTGGHQRS